MRKGEKAGVNGQPREGTEEGGKGGSEERRKRGGEFSPPPQAFLKVGAYVWNVGYELI